MSNSHPHPTKTTSNQISKQSRNPINIPLPPSPPASDALILDEITSQSTSKKISSTRTKSKPIINSLAPSIFLQPIKSSSSSSSNLKNSKRSRIDDDPFDSSSSPPTSPTARKSIINSKRIKPSTPKLSNQSSSLDHRDSPNNPFLTKPGEKSRQAGSRREAGQRKLVYVFRGKRIPYHVEDLDHNGGSPFSLSKPKLLFPSPPTPPPQTKLSLSNNQPVASSSQSVDNSNNQLAFQTPKRDKSRLNASLQMLPTPQSRPRRTELKPTSSNRPPICPSNKSSKTIFKAMR